MMKLSLNGAGLSAGNLSLLEFADLAARHDFAGIDFGIGAAQKTADALGGTTALLDALAAKNIVLSNFGLDVEWRRDEATFQAGLATLPEKAALAQKLGADRCCTWILPATDLETAAWIEQTVRRFTAIGKIFADYGVRFGLEWVGPHHLRAGGVNATGKNPAIWTMAQALDVISQTGCANLGLLVDSYHCYTTGVTEAELAALTDDQIVHVHINDAPVGVGPAGARDGERVLPGTGEIDLAAFLRGLGTAGYSGSISCEVLSPTPIADDPETAATKMRDSLRTVGL